MSGPSKFVTSLPDPGNSSDARTGVVTAVTARGITVAVASGTATAAHLDSYAPAVGDSVALVKTQDSWLCLGRVVGSGTATDFRSPGSGIGPSILAAMHTTANSTLASSTGAAVVVPKYALTFYHPPGHSVLILAYFNWISSVNADWIVCDLTETTSGSAVGEFVQPQVTASFGRSDLMTGLMTETLGGAKRTVTLTLNRLTGTGTTSINQNVNRPGYMIALDLGDKSVVIPT